MHTADIRLAFVMIGVLFLGGCAYAIEHRDQLWQMVAATTQMPDDSWFWGFPEEPPV